MMTLVAAAAQAATNQGGAIQIADAVRVCMAAGLTFLVMRQVMPIAAGLAHGVTLQSYGVVSRAVGLGARSGLGLANHGRALIVKHFGRPATTQSALQIRRP
jgi:type IV secretion system protein VirB6